MDMQDSAALRQRDSHHPRLDHWPSDAVCVRGATCLRVMSSMLLLCSRWLRVHEAHGLADLGDCFSRDLTFAAAAVLEHLGGVAGAVEDARGVPVLVGPGGDVHAWQPRPADPDMEAEMLRRLMVRFGVQEQRAQADLQRASATPRARITKSANGAGHLSIDDQFDRAWRRVGLALDRVGFTVEDRDRSKGLYFVRYVDPEADARSKKASGGLLSKLAFWRDDDDPKARNAQYRIAVKDGTNGSEVNVLNKEGQPDSSPTANRILTLLYEQLK